jgi:hypothetical protein
MKLFELLEVFDGNTAITVNCDDENPFYEQSAKEITKDPDFKTIRNRQVLSFGVELSETDDESPVLYIDL